MGSRLTGRPWEITGQRVLYFTDPHQDLEWVNAMLDREQGNYDHVLCGGDWWDSHRPDAEIAGSAETARFIQKLMAGSHGSFTTLIGNHDLPVKEAFYHAVGHGHIPRPRNWCSGYTNSTTKKVSKVFHQKDWDRFEMFKLVNGWLVSHAGFRECFWKDELDVSANLELLYGEGRDALDQITFRGSRLFGCGVYRGGFAPYGSPVWLDWNVEWQDNLPIKQLCGHTSQHNCVRTMVKSHCLDGRQSTYALIAPDGTIEFKSIRKDIQLNAWTEQTPTYRDDRPE